MNPAEQLGENWREWPYEAQLLLRNRLRQRLAHVGNQPVRRDVDKRRAFVGDHHKYVRDVLGAVLVPLQEQALEAIHLNSRVLLPAANTVGKTYVMAAYGMYIFDAVAALPGDGFEEQGAKVLLLSPNAQTTFSTIYQEMLNHALRAEARGWKMPGTPSPHSVLWRVRIMWFIEAFSPPRRTAENVHHGASGRHFQNMMLIIEEGPGVDEASWRGGEGMCSSTGNKIIVGYNPTEDSGPAAERERSGAYAAIHLSAFDHPNVIERRPVVTSAVGFDVVDSRVRLECRDLGPYPGTVMDPREGDFLYALPEPGLAERGGRTDGIPGHPDAPVRVYRPTGLFDAQVRGLYPRTTQSALCDPAAWDRAVERWRQTSDPIGPPEMVGVDLARSPEGDDPVAVARWGEDAETLLRRHAECVIAGKKYEGPRMRLSLPVLLQKGDGPYLAMQINERWPNSPVNLDEGGNGASAIDHGRVVLKRKDWMAVSFGARPEWMDTPVLGEPLYENLRALLYARIGALAQRDLVDLPPDPELRKEFFAHYLVLKYRSVELQDYHRGTIKELKPSFLLVDKDVVRRRVGHSPDRCDGLVLGAFGGSGRPKYEYRSVPRHGDSSDPAVTGVRGRFGKGGW